MGATGVEPARISPQDPKSCVSANSTTRPAKNHRNGNYYGGFKIGSKVICRSWAAITTTAAASPSVNFEMKNSIALEAKSSQTIRDRVRVPDSNSE